MLFSCNSEPSLYKLLSPEQTGIEFSNNIAINDTFNAVLFEYIYNGGGVAGYDFNGDGLQDLLFTGNQVSSRLYLNKGDLRFEDITEAAGLATNVWCTGVSVADINDDGRPDIYISVAGFNVPEEQMENLLFINQGWDDSGIPKFTEAAKSYGLNDAGYSTQAAFLDYDLDGDVDIYLLTNALEKYNRNNLRPKRIQGEAPSTDRLYRNNGDNTFTNVSEEAGILIEGYGLGINVSDLNFDGYPDVYVSNDFLSNDLIWENQKDGTFINKATDYIKHQTHNGMGVDIADFNNDALPDIAVLDMLPEDNYRQKMMISFINTDKFLMKQTLGYQDQYIRNTIQLHQGFTPEGEPRFSEVANMLGTAATDWSWSVLFADYDNDGRKDVYITNGYRKDVTNLDYVNYSSSNQMFGTKEAKKQKAIEDLANSPDVEVSNYLYHNEGGLTFKNTAGQWGMGQPSFSNGAVYADLDNDGDLDIVVNNIDAPAFVYENLSNEKSPASNYLQVKLRSDSPELRVYNTKVWLYSPQGVQYQEYSPFRGYKSTVGDYLHFGLGSDDKIDSVVVHWPGSRKTVFSDVAVNQRIVLDFKKEDTEYLISRLGLDKAPFQRYGAGKSGLDFVHADNRHSDFEITRTQIHDYSKSGPALAVGDIDGNGLDDLFVGGNRNQKGAIFLQTDNSGFVRHDFIWDSARQDVDALLFDADGDGDNDLYVVGGGTWETKNLSIYQDRLYLNDGKGQFLPDPKALPEMLVSGSCVRSIDFDQDGDLDLFVGGKVIPGHYPEIPRSYLLQNDKGKFVDITPKSLEKPGMLSDALWLDLDGDEYQDLIVVGEWMAPMLVKFEKGNAEIKPLNIEQAKHDYLGWWTHVNAVDIDSDGDLDILLGNIGQNLKLKASVEEPIKLYADDFDNNGAIDPLLSCYIMGNEHIMHERDLLIKQIPAMKRRFPNYQKYAEASLDRTLSQKDIEGAEILFCQTLNSIILENTGEGKFAPSILPPQAQMAPIQGSLLLDVNGDSQMDLLTVGNYNAFETNQIGWADASYGSVLLKSSKEFEFKNLPGTQFGLLADGDVRKIRALKLADGTELIVLAVHGGELKSFRFSEPD